MSKVEIVATPPDGSEGERYTFHTERGRILVAHAREYASASEIEGAAKDLVSRCQPDDIAAVVPHGYEVRVYQVPVEDGGA